jgi:magnesium chelatase family protein
LDELPEFGHRVLEVMCQPMEDKVVTISRAQGSLTFPTNFQLIAIMNPVSADATATRSTCSQSVITRYHSG